MKKGIIICSFILVWFELMSIPTEFGVVKDFLYGNSDAFAYDNWVSHVAEGIAEEGYNGYAPWDRQTNGFGDFLLPTGELLAKWNDIITEFVSGDYRQAQDYIDNYEFPFEVINMLDPSTGHEYFVLREIPNYDYYDDNGTDDPNDDQHGAFDYGWGLFIYNPHATQPIIITAPHPKDDYISVPIAYDAFLKWDAHYLMINGAGREVAWTEIGNYNNGKSLSDPTRNSNHPFHRFYILACEKIREDYGRREFSAQIHSCDWNKHLGYPNVQISAGNGVLCPNLPIRDLSNLKLDVINLSDPIIHEENSIGIHSEVHLNDYYGVYYQIYDFVYEHEDGDFQVNNHISLPGFSHNRQMLYTRTGVNQFDVYEPFFHVEMHELPGIYETTEENWYWFYGYDSATETFDMDNLYTNAMLYYSYWVDKMAEVLPHVFEMDDGLIPEVPQNVSLSQQTFNSVMLTWEPISSFDFYTYEINYSQETFENGNYEVINRSNNPYFASQLHTYQTIGSLEANTVYYFRIKAIDYPGNSSEYSEEIVYQMAPAMISNTKAFGGDNQAVVRWTAIQQADNAGFLVFRKQESTDYELIADWQTDSSLEGSAAAMQEYEWIDNSAENDILYTYKIATENTSGYIHEFPVELLAKPEHIHALIVTSDTESDTTFFGKNLFASDGMDEFYEVVNDDDEQTLFSAFYNPNWSLEQAYFSRIIMGDFNPDLLLHSFSFHVSTSVAVPLTISADFAVRSEKLYLYDRQTHIYYNLLQEQVHIFPQPDELRRFTLYWGNLQPDATISLQTNRIYLSHDTISLSWLTDYEVLIDHFELYAFNDSDTLLIDSDIPPDITFYEFSYDTAQPYHNLKFLLQVHSIDGTIINSISAYAFGIVPSAITFPFAEGNSLIANPFPDQSWSVTELFNESGSLFTLSEDSYAGTAMFEFGQGYWLNIEEPTGYTFQFDIQSGTYYIPLQTGWNLVSNPHLCSHSLTSLRFLTVGIGIQPYSQTVQQGFIAPKIYTYKNEAYRLIDTILPLESFLIYVYQPETNGVLFQPYRESLPLPEPDFEWEIHFDVTQFMQDSDSFTIAAHQHAGDEFDLFFDFPSPPLKPTQHSISAYLKKDAAGSFPYSRLARETKEFYAVEEEFDKRWNFAIFINELEPVTVVAGFINVPPTYEVSIQIEDFSHVVSPAVPFVYQPNSTGEIMGNINVQNIPSANFGDVVEISRFYNYPNPFNPLTSINYHVHGNTHVQLSVYNVKGQKVKTLVNEFQEAGNHSIRWNATDDNGKPVASGIYFYRMRTDEKEIVRKMLLLK